MSVRDWGSGSDPGSGSLILIIYVSLIECKQYQSMSPAIIILSLILYYSRITLQDAPLGSVTVFTRGEGGYCCLKIPYFEHQVILYLLWLRQEGKILINAMILLVQI